MISLVLLIITVINACFTFTIDEYFEFGRVINGLLMVVNFLNLIRVIRVIM